jgi:predicted alpha/beta-fold hydrolase
VSLSGHLWTLSTRLRRRPVAVPSEDRPWETVVTDPLLGPLRLTGRLWQALPATGLILAVHGLGGCAESPYLLRTVAQAAGLGWSILRLNLRGADRLGEDFYHAGLIDDLQAALDSPEVRAHRRVVLVGFSLGGHTVLRWAVESENPRVEAVAAVCAPLDLGASSRSFNRLSRRPYLRHVLAALQEIYEAVARRRGAAAEDRAMPVSLSRARRIRTLEEWDEVLVAPRHGFAGAEDYYQRVSVGPHLSRLKVPALWAGSTADPMVEAASVASALAAVRDQVEVRFTSRGGHMGFPQGLDLGCPGPPGLEGQVLGWLTQSRH